MAKDPRFPNRPDHPDFWLISQAVIDADAAADASQDVESVVAPLVDMKSLAYMAQQRAGRMVDQLPFAGPAIKSAVGAAWIDAFFAGANYRHLKDTDAQSFKDPAEADRLYVLSLDVNPGGEDAHSHMSVHRTDEGARARLVELVEVYGLEDLFEAGKLQYSISHLPIED